MVTVVLTEKSDTDDPGVTECRVRDRLGVGCASNNFNTKAWLWIYIYIQKKKNLIKD